MPHPLPAISFPFHYELIILSFDAVLVWASVSVLQSMNTMVYVFRRGSLAIEQTLPSIPQTVGKMMEGPRNKVEYIHQKRAWAHAVFFLRQEMELYQTFLEALEVKM